jgi:nucleoside-triphosphatase
VTGSKGQRPQQPNGKGIPEVPAAADSPSRRTILLTGLPGSGKTTVMRRLADLLAGRDLAGFYTDEIREAGQRLGFRATTLSGHTCVLAHVRLGGPHRVGRYGVDVAAFEKLVLPELARPCHVMLIDEIGKMECYSSAFTETVGKLLDASRPLVATVALRGSGIIAEAKNRADVEVWQVTKANREELPQRLATLLAAVLDR